MAQLISAKVDSPLAFEWQGQMRYYWEDDKCIIRMVQASFDYGYEYVFFIIFLLYGRGIFHYTTIIFQLEYRKNYKFVLNYVGAWQFIEKGNLIYNILIIRNFLGEFDLPYF